MSCRICGRSSCTESFHAIEDIEKFNKYNDMSHDELVRLCIEMEEEIASMEEEMEILQKKQGEVRYEYSGHSRNRKRAARN